MKNLISAYEKTLKNVAEALSTSLGRTAHWGIAGFREESLVFLLAETMRKLGPDPQYEPCFKDRTRADLCWPKDGKNPSILEAKWWWWSDSLRVVLDDIAAKTAFAKHRGERYGVVFSVDDANCTEGEKLGNARRCARVDVRAGPRGSGLTKELVVRGLRGRPLTVLRHVMERGGPQELASS
jgi:hypothetical protein